MEATATHRMSDSPEKIDNPSVSSASDRLYCELHSEVKSLTEIINILNSKLRIVCANYEASKLLITQVVTGKIESIPCGNCTQLEAWLQEANDEISSQKLIIALLRVENKVTSQLHQGNLKTVITTDTNSDLSCCYNLCSVESGARFKRSIKLRTIFYSHFKSPWCTVKLPGSPT